MNFTRTHRKIIEIASGTMTLSTPVQRNTCLFTIVALAVVNERDPHAWAMPVQPIRSRRCH